MVLTPQENLILVYVYHDTELLQCTAMCQNNYIKSLLLLSVGHSQIRMTKITGTFQCRHGESQSTNWGTKETQSFSPSAAGWVPLPRQSSFWQRMEPAEIVGLYHSSGQAFLSFSFSLPFTVFCFPWGGGGAGEASFLPLLHLHLSPTWSWYKYCTIPLKETHKKDSHRHNQAGGLMPKWVYTGCMEKGPTAPRTRKAGSEYTTNHGIGWCLQQYCK